MSSTPRVARLATSLTGLTFHRLVSSAPGNDLQLLELAPPFERTARRDSLAAWQQQTPVVASSHHLEHIPRWEQEEAWREIYRITKPGGRIEHIVPNCAWAAAKIVDGETDEHVMNVLYGAQEAHGYEREFNLHYFGYTPEVARALAESAGFVDVTTETYKHREELGYNLIVRARKPERATGASDLLKPVTVEA